jgi:hypothetical protein
MKAKVISIIGANGTISKSFRQYLNNAPLKQEIRALQKLPYMALHSYTYFGKC